MVLNNQPPRGPGYRPRGRSRSASPEHQSDADDSIRVIPRERHDPPAPASHVGRQAQRDQNQPSAGDLTPPDDEPTKRRGRDFFSRLRFHGFPSEDRAIDPNLPLEVLIYQYPNHLWGDQLKRLVAAEWTAGTIIHHMHEDARRQFLSRGTSSQPANALTKRLSTMRSRMAKEIETAQHPENPPGRPAPRRPNPTRPGRFLPPRRKARQPVPTPNPAPTPAPRHSVPPPTPPSRSRLSTAQQLYWHRATFRVFVPYDPQNPDAFPERVQQNVYLSYNPPHITTEDPLGVLYQLPPNTAPSTYSRGPSYAPHMPSRQSSVSGLRPQTAPVPTAPIDYSTPRYDRGYGHANDLSQALGYPSDDEQQQQPPLATGEDIALGSGEVPPFEDPYTGEDLGVSPGDPGESDTILQNIANQIGASVNAPNMMRWSPSRRIFTVKTPPDGRRRSSRSNTWFGP